MTYRTARKLLGRAQEADRNVWRLEAELISLQHEFTMSGFNEMLGWVINTAMLEDKIAAVRVQRDEAKEFRQNCLERFANALLHLPFDEEPGRPVWLCLVQHEIHHSVRLADRDAAILRKCSTVQDAVVILSKYAQPGKGMHLTTETGKKRGALEPPFSDDIDKLFYRMEKVDYLTVLAAQRDLEERVSEYPGFMSIGLNVYEAPPCCRIVVSLSELDPAVVQEIGDTYHSDLFCLPIHVEQDDEFIVQG